DSAELGRLRHRRSPGWVHHPWRLPGIRPGDRHGHRGVGYRRLLACMKVDRIILRFVRIPLKFEFQNRWQRIRDWTKLIVELRPVGSGAKVGMQDGLETALRLAGSAVEAGYERLKIKIKPGWDRELLAAVRAAFPRVTILGDANGAYGEGDIGWLAGLEKFAP